MPASLESFIQQNLGIPHVGTTLANRGQCVGLIEAWLAANKLSAIGGNAVDLLNNADLKVYRVIRNTPLNYPGASNVVCWDKTWGNGYGHTAVVIAANMHYIVVFEQNDPDGSPPIVQTHGYAGVAGWIVLPS